jgi:hypothetical protein
MSVFTKRRKIRRKEKEEIIQRLEEGNRKIEKTMNRMVDTAKLIEKEHPDFEELDEVEKVKLFAEYYDRTEYTTD